MTVDQERGPPPAVERAARRHGARLQVESADVGHTFVCTGRLYGEGRLYLLLQPPGTLLLVEHPPHLAHVRKGEHLLAAGTRTFVRSTAPTVSNGEGTREP